MKIRVKLMAGLASALDSDEIELELPDNATVKDLLSRLASMSDRLRSMINGDEWSVIVLIEDKPARYDSRLKDGSRVVLVPGLAGG